MAIYNPDAPSRQPLSRREKLLRATGAAALLGVTAYLLANWGSLPVRLPSHYGLGGEIDGWSGRGSLGLLLGIGWGIWLLLLVTRHFPRGWPSPAFRSPIAPVRRSMPCWARCSPFCSWSLPWSLPFSPSGHSPTGRCRGGGGLRFWAACSEARGGISAGQCGWAGPHRNPDEPLRRSAVL